MVRFFIKGGVWKNSEDEVLKAGIMKYGKNNWERIASLLPRKTGKQCKARWYEWLDPSIKKTEWTRAEDEKLLHMAKVMPTQWRSIAPIVGRTAAQCLQRYERLLAAAHVANADDPEAAEAANSAAAEARRLRPGEIDPQPETKPARPDAIDMDDDELEMLAEARARLANTKGKKAKRKAREKQLAEARRLALLQKRRELKAAGLIRDVNAPSRSQLKRKRKSREIDYNAEIPFHKPAPAGFYDTRAEDAQAKDQKFVKKRRSDITTRGRKEREEQRRRKEDKKKKRRLLSENLPAMVDRVSRMNDPRHVDNRPKLMLPPPSVNVRDLEAVSRLNAQAAGASAAIAAGGYSATRALIADRGAATPSATPLSHLPQRTPMGRDTVMEEARHLAALQARETPLAGGAGDSHGPGATGRDSGAEMPTPMSYASELDDARTAGMSTAASSATGGATPGPEESGGIGRRRRRSRKRGPSRLHSQLAALPEPQFEHEVAVPADDGTVGSSGMAAGEDAVSMGYRPRVPDAALESDARAAAAAQDKHARFLLQSAAVRLGLPRPTLEELAGAVELYDSGSTPWGCHDSDPVLKLVMEEAFSRMIHDATEHVEAAMGSGASTGEVRKVKRRKTTASTLARRFPSTKVPSSYQRWSDALIRQELAHSESSLPDAAEFEQILRKVRKDYRESAAGVAELQQREKDLDRATKRSESRSSKLRKNVHILTKGLRKRNLQLRAEIAEMSSRVVQAEIDLGMYTAMGEQELRAASRRLKQMDEQVGRLSRCEQGLQSAYAERRAQEAAAAAARSS